MRIDLPVEYLMDARAAVLEAAEEFNAVDAERGLYPKTYDEAKRLQGEEGASRFLIRKAQFEGAELKVTRVAQDKISKARQAYVDAVNNQITPRGEDITGADYALLKDDLVDTPEALSNLIARNDTFAFIAAAAKYAREKGWDGFNNDLDVIAQVYLDYGNGYLDVCESAAENPVKGYNGMLVAHEGELARRASAYGIREAFNEAIGE